MGLYLTEISTKLSTLVEKAKEQATLDVIKSLDFDDTKKRAFNISENYVSTFEWVFDAIRPPHDSNFRSWLQSDSDMFWVSGQPGSGKSTLMKYIVNDPRTQRYLQHWAGQEKLFIASHFFWNAGDTLQGSLQGFLQSLLYDILSHCPAIVSTVCSSRFFQSKMRTAKWTERELLDAFERLRTGSLPGCLCCFVDGLDEFDGDQMEIIRIVRELASPSRVKFCFSNRPWTMFLNAFAATQRLILEENTKSDIEAFVNENSAQDERYVRFIHLGSDDELYKKFPKQIVDDAQGFSYG